MPLSANYKMQVFKIAGGKSMQTDTKAHIMFFLQEHKDDLLIEWYKSVIISDSDPYKEDTRKNGEEFFQIIIDSFNLSHTELLKIVHKIAVLIAEERVKADINIGDFVYNVNLGRSIFFSSLSEIGLDWSSLQESINTINCIFDKFLYYAISHYAESQNKIIEEKTKFIDSTHQDRLTLLGQMTSSFIHEFRNPLTSIYGFIQLLKADYPDMKYLNIISSELDQLNFRISQFLLLSKKELIGKEKVYFGLKQLIEEVLSFLYPSILDGNVKIIKELCGDIHLYGYSDEIRQVFINIVFNAIDELGHQPNLNPLVEIKSYSENNAYVYIDIANNGPMIPEELQKTIFEPFFTTKKLGTGLGLFVCKEIIEKHKGELTCDSNPKKTTFTIKLPIAAKTSKIQ